MMNCNKPKRFNGMDGSIVPEYDSGGNFFDMSQQQQLGNDQIMEMARLAGVVPGATPPAKTGQKKGINWQDFTQAAGLGAMAGMGGKQGMIMAPIMAMLMQLPQFKKLTSGRTPGFNPNAEMMKQNGG